MKSVDDNVKLIGIESSARKLHRGEMDSVIHPSLNFNEKELREVRKLLDGVGFFISKALNRGIAEEKMRKEEEGDVI